MKKFRISRDAIYYQFISGIDTNAAGVGDTLTACKDSGGWYLLNAAGAWHFCPLGILRAELDNAREIIKVEKLPKKLQRISPQKKPAQSTTTNPEPGPKGNAASRTRRASSLYHGKKQLFISVKDLSNKRKKARAEAVKVSKVLHVISCTGFSFDAFIYKNNEPYNKFTLSDVNTGCLIAKSETVKKLEEKLTDEEFLNKIKNAMAGAWYQKAAEDFKQEIYKNTLATFDIVKDFYNNLIMVDALQVLEAVTA